MSHLGLAREISVFFWRSGANDLKLAPLKARGTIVVSIEEDAAGVCRLVPYVMTSLNPDRAVAIQDAKQQIGFYYTVKVYHSEKTSGEDDWRHHQGPPLPR